MRRQYSLPHCTLSIDGLGDENGLLDSFGDNRPLISTLMDFECQLVGVNHSGTLRGGKAFFDCLLREVNRYTQGFLSGIEHPVDHHKQKFGISLEAIKQKNLHRLTVQSSETGKEAIMIDLTTVQLFDLVESLDQLLADPQTLPELQLSLNPLSSRYRLAEQSLARQVAPATFGLTSLTVAGLALFFLLPVPPQEVKDPNLTTDNTEQTSENSENPETLTREELEQILAQAPEIDSPTELNFIQRYVERKINQDWRERDQITTPTEFVLTVARDGSLLNYEPLEGTEPTQAQLTPLESLRYLPTRNSEITKEPIAKFKAVFNNQFLTIDPITESKGLPGFGPEIKNKNQLKDLTRKLRQILLATYKENQRFSVTLTFRVGMTENGEIGDYEAQNAQSKRYEREAPLAELLNLEAVGIFPGGSLVPQKPLGQFKVVFYPNGKLEVSPWHGY